MKRTVLIILACCFLIPGGMTRGAESEAVAVNIPIRTVHTDSFSMDYFCFGHGERALVILPGLSVDSVMKYADTVAEAYRLFTDEFTVYLFDRRKELPEAYTVYEMARDTAAIRALGLEKACLFGASQGGMIAMAMAVSDPELIGRLVLGSTSANMKPERYRTIEQWVQLAKAGNREELYLAFGEAIYPKDVFEQARGLLTESAKGIREEDLSRFVILAEGTKGFNVADQLQKIACPVLVIGSEDDRVLGADSSREIAEKLKSRPDCELYMYDGYGHAVYDLAPDYKERLLRFFVR